MTFTCVGYYQGSPHCPLYHVVEADDIRGAIAAAEASAHTMSTSFGYEHEAYINTFVFEGECEVLSTWAG